MAARGLVNGRSPLRRSGRDLVFRCYPPELLSPHKKTEADLLGQPLAIICNKNDGKLTKRILISFSSNTQANRVDFNEKEAVEIIHEIMPRAEPIFY